MAEHSKSSGIGGRVAVLAGRASPWLAGAIALALALRLVVTLAYRPAVLTVGDSGAYVTAASGYLFSDPVHTAGYPMFLRLFHALSASLDLTIAVQHLLGVATGAILYATVRRIGAPVWVALLAAAAILFSLDQVVLEHTLMAETMFGFGISLVTYFCVRALEPARPLFGPVTSRDAWIVAAGLVLGLSVWVRAVGAPLVPFLCLWIALAIPGTVWTRLGRAALAGAMATAVVLVYMGFNQAATGNFVLTYAPGWALYSRTAPFADCSGFEPPKGTEDLCEQIPAGERPGPEFYGYDPASPARRVFDHPARGDHKLRAFGRTAILHQPLDYVLHVSRDVARYYAPFLGPERPFWGAGHEVLDIRVRAADVEQQVQSVVDGYYDSGALEVGGAVARLGEAQSLLRVHPVLLLAATLLGIVAVWLTSGRRRAAVLLLLGAGLLLLVVPSATATYNARYAIPAAPLIGAAGAIGLWLAVERWVAPGPQRPVPTADRAPGSV